MKVIPVEVYLQVWCILFVCVELACQAELGNGGKSAITEMDLLSLHIAKNCLIESSNNTDVAAESDLISITPEDFDLSDEGEPGEVSSSTAKSPTHRQKRTFWPFTNWFGYDYDYGYMPPGPPMMGGPGFFGPGYGPGFGHGFGRPMPPPPPLLGLGFRLGF